MPREPKPRAVFIDVARAVAVFLAMLPHALATFVATQELREGTEADVAMESIGPLVSALPTAGVESFGPTWSPPSIIAVGSLIELAWNGIVVMARGATPAFFIIFGIMVEIVYVKRWQQQGGLSVARRLATRSSQCYLGYASVSIAGLLAGGMTMSEFGRSLLGLAPNHFGNILLFYAIALLAMIPLLKIRLTLGAWVPAAIIVAVWIIDPVLDLFTWPDRQEPIARWTGMLFGRGETGFSLIHGMTFMMAGLLLGMAIKRSIHRGTLGAFHLASLAMMLVAALVTAGFILQYGPSEFARLLYFDNVFRGNHHPAYYSSAGLQALLMISLMALIFPLSTRSDDVNGYGISLGRSSLIAFAAGNAGLALLFPFQATSVLIGGVMAGAFMLALPAITSGIAAMLARLRPIPKTG
ncbi:MAG: hypothetical protein JJU36_03180 [Phycisphaeraceae bacterium]|nr:hypothetical protein [Phycisphaeraceae bacterium]